MVMRFAAANLRQGGTMIVQSYCGSLDVLDHRYYLWACDRQLAGVGMQLRELYRFMHTTGTMIYVASKGTPDWPLATRLTALHGRAEPERVQGLRIVGPPPGEADLFDAQQYPLRVLNPPERPTLRARIGRRLRIRQRLSAIRDVLSPR
jgi:hypothetical protein